MKNNFDIQNMLQEGLTLHRAGQFNEAESLYLKILQLKPSNPDANNLMGVLYHQFGRNEEAIDFIKRALRKKPKDDGYLRNLGSVLGALGQMDGALKQFRKSLHFNPKSIETHYNIGCALQQKELHFEAIESFQKVLALNPENAKVQSNIGSSLMMLGRNEEALVFLQKALDLAPTLPEAHFNIGLALGRLFQHDKAIQHYRQAIKFRADYAQAYNNMGNAFFEQKRLNEALDAFNNALSIDPDFVDAHINRGVVLDELDMPDAALEVFKRSVELDPNSAVAQLEMGVVYQRLGDRDKARSSLKKAIQLFPGFADAHRRLTRTRKHTVYDDEIREMEDLFVNPDSRDEDKMLLAFGLGEAFENLGQFERSFEYYSTGNLLNRKTYSYDVSDDEAYFQKMSRTFSSSFFSSRKETGLADETPIFILGMPRSGTSLVEQILASHPDVHGSGELDYLSEMCAEMNQQGKNTFPECFLDLAPERHIELGREYVEKLRRESKTERLITDKMPNNFIYIGLIWTILPKATIIHCNRNPMDTCFSIYKNFFSGSLNFAYNLEELGRYYQLYLKYINHWRGLFPDKLIEVHYEQMVENPDKKIRELLTSCGLPFHEDCLNFHKSGRSVKTVSNYQVRKPVYQSSVDSWKRFEAQLEPLSKAIYGN
ncbi:MAG: tetratricopeptide repeat protein [Nitrospinae bacterium]|nr:tetratricopeptide repeat protein [Nitrospinota bacterium]